jgi:hypothetical protein
MLNYPDEQNSGGSAGDLFQRIDHGSMTVGRQRLRDFQ